MQQTTRARDPRTARAVKQYNRIELTREEKIVADSVLRLSLFD